MSQAEFLLNRGLKSGYVGQESPKQSQIQRGPFVGKSLEVTYGADGVYHDEWFANRTGGGQELVTIDGKTLTRLYGGGLVSEERMREADVKDSEVIRMLRSFLLESDGKSRLYENYEADITNGIGYWRYEYRVIANLGDIPVTLAIETINYELSLVFAHSIIISPIE